MIIQKIPKLIVLIALLLLAAACGAARDSVVAPAQSVSGEAEEAEMAIAEEPMAPPGAAADYADGEPVPLDEYLANTVAAQEQRVVIYTGNISLVVKNTQEAVDAISALVGEQGGFVSGSNIFQSGEALRGSVTIRVPAERYQTTLSRLREMALRVERENTSTEDVTEEFTDLQARKTNLEFTEDALQQLLEERQRVGSTSDILEVYRELTNIRGQIEQIEGRLRYLANQSALSTITIELTPDILYQPIQVAGWEPRGVAKEALQALIAALQGLGNIVIWAVVFVLPLLLVLLIPLVIVFWVIRFFVKRRKARKQQTEAKA